MSKTVAEQWCDRLTDGGFRLLYSLAGECDNTLMTALHREKRFTRRVELQQESAVVLAAAAGARVTGEPTVCYAGSFPGIGSIAAAWEEVLASQARLLVLGVLHGGEAWRRWAGSITVVQRAEEAAAALSAAIRRVRDAGNPVLLLLREEVAGEAAVETVDSPPPVLPASPCRPHPAVVAEMASVLAASERTVFLCGHGCAGAREEILAVARRLQAPVAFTLSGKEIMEGDNELGIGMPGVPGWGAAPYAVTDCDVLVLWGTDFPYPELLPIRGKVVQVDRSPEALGRRMTLRLGVVGDVRQVALALLPLLPLQANDEFALSMRSLHRREQTRLESHVRSTDETCPLRPELVTRLLSDSAEPDAIFCVDTGAPLAWCAAYLHPAGRQRLVGSFRLGLRECALPMGVGIKAAYPSRQVIAVCTAEGALRHLDELLTLLREFLSLKILVFRRIQAESIRIDTGHSGAQNCRNAPLSVAALASSMGVTSATLRHAEKLYQELRQWLAEPGPAVLEVDADAYALQPPPEMLVYGTAYHRAVSGTNGGKDIFRTRRFYR